MAVGSTEHVSSSVPTYLHDVSTASTTNVITNNIAICLRRVAIMAFGPSKKKFQQFSAAARPHKAIVHDLTRQAKPLLMKGRPIRDIFD